MIAFRKKNRSDEIIDPKDFHPGLIVWAGTKDGRQERFCSGPYGELLTREEHERRKLERAERNRAANRWNGQRRHSHMNERHHSLALW